MNLEKVVKEAIKEAVHPTQPSPEEDEISGEYTLASQSLEEVGRAINDTISLLLDIPSSKEEEMIDTKFLKDVYKDLNNVRFKVKNEIQNLQEEAIPSRFR